MNPRAKAFTIRDFKGLNEVLVLGSSRQLTSSLEGVEVRHGKVLGQKGIAKFDGITTQASPTPIIGLFNYLGKNLDTQILRMLTDTVEKYNSGTSAWDDVTGTALTGASTDRPGSVVIDDTLVFTNEGSDRPRSYNGSGNTTVLGGTPPFAKVIGTDLGFLFLANISDDGTFSDLTNGYRLVRYSADWNADWTFCDGNQIELNATGGEIRAMCPFGRAQIWGKSDGLVATRFVGGAVRFTQERIPFDKGVAAPLSMQVIGEAGCIFLATDMELYITNGSVVKPLPPNVNKTLQETLSISKAKISVGVVHPDKETYSLFYNRTGGTWLDGRVMFNFRTGEFSHRSYGGHAFVRVMSVRLDQDNPNILLGSTTDLVFQIDSGTDDDGTAVTRRYDTDWQDMESTGDKIFYGVNLTFKRKKDVRIKISVAQDFEQDFRFERTYDLKGLHPDRAEVRINYEVPSPIKGTHFNVRVRIFHDGSTNVGEMRQLDMLYEPTSQVTLENQESEMPISA